MGEARRVEVMKSSAFPDFDLIMFFNITERVIAELLIAVKWKIKIFFHIKKILEKYEQLRVK
jgi:hypothetical protein